MMSKITDELKKYKNAATSEAKETRLLVKILMSAAKDYKKDKKFKLDDEDIQFIKDQSQDLLKLIPLIVIQILPGSTIATPFIVELSKKLGIKLNSKIPEKHKEKKSGGEIDELVNSDGSMIGKSTPMLDLGMHPRKTMDQTVIATRQTNNIDRLSEKLKNKFFNKVSKEADLNTIAGRKKGELREDFINRRKETIAAVKDIRVEAFNALKQLPQMGSISDDAIAVAQGDYRMMKKREVNLADPADINEFASFATGYQKRLDALREKYKDRPPERLYHGTTTERTPAKITRGFLDPQTIQNKQHHELNVGATSFTRDLRLNYYNPEFGGPNVKNISYTDIPYADYLFRRVDMPLSAYEKELGKDFNYMAQAITGSPDIARPLGLPRSLIFRETEDAFLESPGGKNYLVQSKQDRQ